MRVITITMMNENKTVRRDTLLKKARAGKLIAIEGYHYDDMMGEDRFKGELPVKVIEDSKGYQEGFYCVPTWDFDSNGGRATRGENGIIHLRVHSNYPHTFREV